MTIEITITVEWRDDIVIARLDGALTLATAPEVRSRLLKCLAECPAALIVDLAAVTVDSTLPLTVFRAVQWQAHRWPGAVMLLCRASPVIVEAAMGRDLPIYPTLEDALAALARPPLARPTVHADLPPTVQAVPRARDVVVEACHQWGLDDQTGIAEVIVAELVSNAVCHGSPPLRLYVSLRRDRLHLAVRDGSPVLPQVEHRTDVRPEPTAERGRGLYLINAFATTWGSMPTAGGKIVWATLRPRAA